MAQTERTEGNPRFTIHDRLRKARESAGLEQIELAEAIEVDRGSISNYETGKTTRLKSPVLKRWAMACDVTMDWLTTGAESGTHGDPSAIGESSSACTRSPLRLVA